ncbi:MAG TPA: hypothetical protein VFG87_14840 [Amycolatopsis sp.]|nr:hypothetical protein [Amycolatopsis sp.]
MVPLALAFGITSLSAASTSGAPDTRGLAAAAKTSPARQTAGAPQTPTSQQTPPGKAPPTGDPAANPDTNPAAGQAAGNPAGNAPKGQKKREAPPPQPGDQANQANPNCTLRVPANPLSAQGLATPYVLSGTQPGGACKEANADQSAFVEATIVDPATGQLSVYRPLVIDRGTKPAADPVVPTLPAGAVVGIWFGFNGDTLTLSGMGNSLADGNCVNGLNDSLFGQFAHCNAPALFAAANKAIGAKQLTVPPLGTGKDGLPCPTVRDFGLVDQDQSDNVTTTYVATADGRTAQAGAAAGLGGTTKLTNGSDNGLLAAFVDPALGCRPFTAPDLSANGAPATSLALNELQAAADQAPPVALIPPNDPMAQVDGKPSVAKVNLYRAGVDQPPLNVATETGQAYCTNLMAIGKQRLMAGKALFTQAPSPDPAAANLFEFLTQRLQGSIQNLGCQNNR